MPFFKRKKKQSEDIFHVTSNGTMYLDTKALFASEKFQQYIKDFNQSAVVQDIKAYQAKKHAAK